MGDRGRRQLASAANTSVPGIGVGLDALPTTMRLILAAIVVSSCTAGALQGEVVSLPEGRVVGGVVRDDGTAMIAVAKNWREEGETTALVPGSGPSTLMAEVPTDYARGVRFLPGRGFVLTSCPPMFDGDNHCDLVHRVYRLNEAGRPQLSGEWDPRNMPNPNAWFDSSSSISSDGTAWIAVRALEGRSTRREFALGTTSSPRATRMETIAFESVDAGMPEMGLPPVHYLDPGQGLVLIPWGGGAYILRFAETGVHVAPHFHEGPGKITSFRWQEEARVLWALVLDSGFLGADTFPVPRPKHTWLAYNLGNLLPGSEPPSEPFWTILVDPVSTSGWPHPHRGFVEVRSGASGFRVTHRWRSPNSEEPARRRASNCQPGDPEGAIFVSSNGDQAIVIEGEDDRHRARRIDLHLAPSTNGPIPDCDLDTANSENLE